jgi:hypothetical protein
MQADTRVLPKGWHEREATTFQALSGLMDQQNDAFRTSQQ